MPGKHCLLVGHTGKFLAHILKQLLVLCGCQHAVSKARLGMAHLLRDRLLIFWDLEFHASQPVLNVTRRLSHLGPAQPTANGLLRLILEAHKRFHHIFSLPQRAELVIITVAILL